MTKRPPFWPLKSGFAPNFTRFNQNPAPKFRRCNAAPNLTKFNFDAY